MIIALIILTICNLGLIYSVINYLVKRKNLGKVLLKIKPRTIPSVLTVIFCIGSIAFLILITLSRVKELNTSPYYNPIDSVTLITAECVYALIILKSLIQLIASREIRENGITLSGIVLDYSDIRHLEWKTDNKIEIKYPARIINRIFKERWYVVDDQIDELTNLIKKKYFDMYNLNEG